jgi:uncharacterized membrane protein
VNESVALARNLFGHFHPMLVHFPLAFLLGGAALETWQALRGDGASPVARILLVMGALGALLAASAGLALFRPEDFAPRLLAAGRIHRSLGLTATGLSLVALALSAGGSYGPSGRRLVMYRVSYILAAMVVGMTGHYGGWMVFGWGRVWIP